MISAQFTTLSFMYRSRETKKDLDYHT